jgi:hypothetical protein
VIPLQFDPWRRCPDGSSEQRDVIDLLPEERAELLKAQLRGRRVRLTDDQRRRLAVLGRQIGRRTMRSRPL